MMNTYRVEEIYLVNREKHKVKAQFWRNSNGRLIRAFIFTDYEGETGDRIVKAHVVVAVSDLVASASIDMERWRPGGTTHVKKHVEASSIARTSPQKIHDMIKKSRGG
ncbi:MAG: hypothetical protein GXO43_06000 [Crenarchaeota archaeon]|nr:hypothetical protein [Thermoproteota archaeon]